MWDPSAPETRVRPRSGGPRPEPPPRPQRQRWRRRPTAPRRPSRRWPSPLTILVIAATVITARSAGAQPPVTPQANAPFPRVGSPIVVAIDPGHGGTNLGAAGLGRGIFEKQVTLALANRVRVLLAESPGSEISVVLCRESDVLVPIRARARCARDSGADLFISLHTNAVPAGVRPGSQHGFEIFVLGPREVEDDATLAALGHTDDADAVWGAHEIRAAAEQSIVLGGVLADALTRALGPDARRGIKQSGAALDVLRGSGAAAALVEVGFLDHPDEGARLATPEGREPIARALAAAVRTYARTNPQERLHVVDAGLPPSERRGLAPRLTHPSSP